MTVKGSRGPRALLLGALTLALTLACAQPGGGRTAPAAAPGASAPTGSTSAAGPAAAAPSAGAAAPAPTSSVPAPLTKVRMAVTAQGATSWHPAIANDRGYFQQEGIDFEILTIPSSVTQTQALIAGDVQINTYSVDSVAKAVVGGAPLKLIGSAQEVPSFVLIVDHDIKTWNDLRGKTLGAGSPGGYYDVILRAMLTANGLHDGDYQLRSIGNSNLRLPAIQAGQISGAIVGDTDGYVADAQGYQSLGSVHQYVKDVQYTGYAIADAWGKSNEDVVVGFLRGVLRAIAWLNDPANKTEAKRIYHEISGLEEPYLEESYDQMVVQKMMSTTARPNMKGLENIGALTYQYGGLQFIPPLDSWVDMSYLDKAERTLSR
ncbi:MAG TPA: ABC transporter substrate-binding protein [Chloroflexota bacterium]